MFHLPSSLSPLSKFASWARRSSDKCQRLSANTDVSGCLRLCKATSQKLVGCQTTGTEVLVCVRRSKLVYFSNVA